MRLWARARTLAGQPHGRRGTGTATPLGVPGRSGGGPGLGPCSLQQALRSRALCPPAAAVFYCYFYKRTAVRLGDPRLYQDSVWLRKEFTQVRR